ncbi:aldehyde dehydrogenase family protein [Streptomyces sp. M19]
MNSGQDCTAATRAYVQRPLYDAFVAAVADLMATVRLGDPFDPRTDLGPSSRTPSATASPGSSSGHAATRAWSPVARRPVAP